MQQREHPTPQTLLALLERSQQLLAQARSGNFSNKQDYESRIGDFTGNIGAIRGAVSEYKDTVLSDENVALRQVNKTNGYS
ncbi:hypothetical protein HKX48_002786 [Thoreauomyces humboldtii]|nr:hypothetical protein HKX48_002786 [Thoreauomyces humboldtii]